MIQQPLSGRNTLGACLGSRRHPRSLEKKKEVRVDITLAATFSIVAFPRAAARGTAAINHPFLCFHTYHPPAS